jgi:hypothetical protein
MSLVKFKPVKPSYSRYSEGWQEWLKTSKGRVAMSGAVGESGNNSYCVAIQHHGGVSGDGMFGSNMEISREILTDAEPKEAGEATRITSCQYSKGVLVCQEVGVAHYILFPALIAKPLVTALKYFPQAVRWLKAFCQKDQPPIVGSISERAVCHASCIHGHRTTSVIRRRAFSPSSSPRSGGPSMLGTSPFLPSSVQSLVDRITESCVKSWSVRPASWLASFVGVVKNGLPCRSRASPPAAPRRPPAPRHRDRASPHAAPPRSTPPSGPAPVSASSLASVLRNPPTSSGGAGKRIGHLFWRVRSFSSRFAAGRSRPQQETFRRPTAILVDPAPTTAALVHTDFARQSPSPKARPVARNLRAAVAVGLR